MPRFLVRHRLLRFLPALGLSALWLAVLAFTAWQATTWFWRFKQPAAVVAIERIETDPIAAAQRIESRHLFGGASNVAGSGESVPASVSSFTLLGVATRSNTSPGFAVLREQGASAQGFVEGETISPGVRLVKIAADSVEIDRNGIPETVRLVESTASRGAPPPLPTMPPQMRPSAPPIMRMDAMPQRLEPPPVPQAIDGNRNEMPNSQ